MAKGDDAVRKKLNKANRKKLRKDDRSSSTVTARVASIIAAKKRRQSGKRRKCQVFQSDVVYFFHIGLTRSPNFDCMSWLQKRKRNW